MLIHHPSNEIPGLYFDEATQDFYLTIDKLAHLLHKSASAILRVVKRGKMVTRLEQLNVTQKGYCECCYLNSDQILEILERYSSDKLHEFCLILDKQEALTAE